MEKKSLLELENKDCKEIIKRIKDDAQNGCGLIKLIKDLTGRKYIEEKNFVQFNIITKEKNHFGITCENLSLGYLLPDNTIYDFISGNVFTIYRLHEINNNEKNGKFALINHIINENSNTRLKLNNLTKMEELFQKYIHNAKQIEKDVINFKKNLENNEYIPEFSKTLRRY